jgi:Arc/MetJ family transcription regulator
MEAWIMANITLSIDDALLQAARVRAVKEGTSVNEICRQAIERYARRNEDRLARYLELQARIDADPGASGPRLPKETREEMHERHSGRDPKR